MYRTYGSPVIVSIFDGGLKSTATRLDEPTALKQKTGKTRFFDRALPVSILCELMAISSIHSRTNTGNRCRLRRGWCWADFPS